MLSILTRRRQRTLAILATALAAVTLLAWPAAAQDEPAAPQLGIAPVGYDGPWFDLELEPGDNQHLNVELANHGEQPIDAHTYAADVYTLIGGGMGVSLRDEPASGSTRWVDYPTQTLGLQPDEGDRRTVTVTVPTDAEPGQYITALVVENDQPISAEGELSVERVMRQALAVNITVPGPPQPALEITDARHTDPGGRSVVLLGVDNTGNRHLQPTGELALTDSSGATVATEQLAMAIHFAKSATEVELTLDELLAPGTYTIAADLRDDEHDVDASGSAQFEVIAPPREGSAIPGRDRLEDALRDAGLPSWVVLVATALVLLALVLLIGLVVRRLLRRPVVDEDVPNASEPGSGQQPSRPPRDTSGPTPSATLAVPRPEDRLAGVRTRGSATAPEHAPDPVRQPVDLSTFHARTVPKRAEQREASRGGRRRS